MLFNKSILAVAVMALANVVVAGTDTVQTPACVLKIIGNTKNPGDTKAICGADAKNIQSQISKNCGDDKEAALKFFVDNCADLGHKVASASATATGSSSTGFVTATQTGSSTSATGTSASGTKSAGGSTASATFNAALSDRKFDATTFAAAVFIGAAALL